MENRAHLVVTDSTFQKMSNSEVTEAHAVSMTFVTPVYNPPLWALRECANSIVPQLGDRVDWILVDDGSSSNQHVAFLNELDSLSNVTVVLSESNGGISHATNLGIERASGDFIAFIDQDDLLARGAVHAVRTAIAGTDEIDIVYSDEDKIDENGRHYGRFRKPVWSPERLRHQNYLSHLTVLRKSLIEAVGGLRADFDGSQDFDLVLRCSEKARRIVHIPRVLYHWRAIESSTASTPEAKPAAHLAAVRAVQEHLDRIGKTGTASLMPNMYVDIEGTTTWQPKVSIIIPSNGSESRVSGHRVCLVENCVQSLVTTSTYENVEIIIVLDDDSPDGLKERLTEIDPGRVRIIDYDKEFNFSEKINNGVAVSSGDVVVPLNDDTQVLTPNWIEELLVLLEQTDVGVVAPLLCLSDGRIQSAGHFFQEGAHHVGAGLASDDDGPFGVLSFASERSGATFAAVAIRREVYEQAGGLSEEFPRAFNDVDFCNKLSQLGYRTIVTPKAVVYHFESLTRDPKVDESEVRKLYERWGHVITEPDHYLPHFWRQCHGIE